MQASSSLVSSKVRGASSAPAGAGLTRSSSLRLRVRTLLNAMLAHARTLRIPSKVLVGTHYIISSKLESGKEELDT